jgi:hypothetical protein
MQQRNLYSFLAFDFGRYELGSHLTVLRRTKIGDYDVKEAVDVVVFEDNLESNPYFETFKDAIIRTLFFGSVLPKINNSLIPNLKLHWLSPEILKAEKLISVRT